MSTGTFENNEYYSLLNPFHVEVNEIGLTSIFMPKVYVRRTTTFDGSFSLMFSLKPQEGFHLHPAFMHNGQEVEHGILFDNNLLTFSSIDFVNINDKLTKEMQEIEAKTFANDLEKKKAMVEVLNNFKDGRGGYHIYNIYEDFIFNLLLAAKEGLPYNYIYRNDGILKNINSALMRMFDYQTIGLEVRKTKDVTTGEDVVTLWVMDNKGYGNMINTGLKVGVDLPYHYMLNDHSEYHDLKTDNFDLGDLFIPKYDELFDPTVQIPDSYVVNTDDSTVEFVINSDEELYTNMDQYDQFTFYEDGIRNNFSFFNGFSYIMADPNMIIRNESVMNSSKLNHMGFIPYIVPSDNTKYKDIVKKAIEEMEMDTPYCLPRWAYDSLYVNGISNYYAIAQYV